MVWMAIAAAVSRSSSRRCPDGQRRRVAGRRRQGSRDPARSGLAPHGWRSFPGHSIVANGGHCLVLPFNTEDWRAPPFRHRIVLRPQEDGDDPTLPRHALARGPGGVDRPDPADPAPPRLRGHRLQHPGQGGVHEPGRFGEGSRRPLHHRRRREARRAEARRHHRGGHRRQHRHRPHAGRQRARLSLRHRDAGDAEQGEDRLPAHDRRRPAPGAGEAVSRSRQLRARLAADGGGDRRGVGQPVRQPGEPRGPPHRHRPGDLGADRRPRRCVHLRLRHRRHAGRRRASR